MGRRPTARSALPALASALLVACGGAHDTAMGPGSIGDARTRVTVAEAPADGTDTAEVSTPDRVADAVSTNAAVMAAAPEPTTTVAAASFGPARTASLAFTGDVLPHSPLWRGAQANAGGVGYDFRPMFAEIEPVIAAADLAICHLETPIAPADEELSTDPLYGVPAEIAVAIAASGHDRCSTASNHVLDRRVTGIDRTVEELEANGVGQSGMARTPDEIEPDLFDVKGITMAHASYTYGTNGIPVPADEPWRTALIDVDRILRDAQLARDRGSEFTIVSLHWGEERESEPTPEQRAIAERLTASSLVDLIVGHHVHVVQPIERVNGVWVAYGIGNILSNLPVADYWPAASQDGVVVAFDVTVDDGVVEVSAPVVTPTWVDKENGWVIRDVRAILADPARPDWLRDVAARSLERTASVLGDHIPAT